MLNFVQIKDFITNETYQIVFSEEDFDEIDSIWENQNNNLIKFEQNSIFLNRTSLSSLLPVHFQILLSSHIEKLSGLSKEDREKALFDDDDERHHQMKLLIMGFIRSIINYTTSYVDLVNLEILSNYKINISLTLGMSIETTKTEGEEPKPKLQKGNLKIVVDNTNKF